MVVTYTQGSPYIFTEVANSEAATIKLATNGVFNYEFFSVDGNQINGSSHVGDGIIIKLVQKHIGYDTYRPAQVGQPIYGDRYYLISTPDETTFALTSDNHPSGLNNLISMDLNDENYFSIAPLNTISEGSYYHEHAYNKPLKGNIAYNVDYDNSDVITTYSTSYQTLKENTNTNLIQFLMPHHHQHTDSIFTEYITDTIRGELKLIEGNAFQTTMSFNGVLPAMTHPNTSAFSETEMTSYLEDLATRTRITDEDNFLNDEGPYWNGKALYPLAQGIIIADQINDETLKNELIERLQYLLSDWFTVSSTNDERYLFYNQTWGTTYYSNNDFNTASELSDHTFTHGYLVYAASVLAMYDPSFKADYGDVVELLLRDYMHPVKDDDAFAYLRSFDAWAGHTWAHGFGTFAEGNNIESSSEAINAWVGGYLWALSTGDQALKDAAIYGFVHELNHAKTFMFDYSETVFHEDYAQYADVAAMIWGGKYDYATWFGANPTFIYGIQWLPNGEYLSSYALNDEEYDRLSDIYTSYLAAKNNQIDTWFANMWSIQALIDPSLALNQFDAFKILNDDYPSDLSQTYYLLHGLNAYGRRTTDYVMEIHDAVASSIYSNQSGDVHALVWNPTTTEQTITFKTPTGDTITHTVEASSFVTLHLNA
jgi:endoglucanase Acf2